MSDPTAAAFDETLLASDDDRAAATEALLGTLAEDELDTHEGDVALGSTRLDTARSASQLLADATLTSLHRSTVLPRADTLDGRTPMLVVEGRQRYEPVRELGEGASGAVVLVQDNDIERKVALKRLKRADDAAVARFAEEIRTVGRLEHPGIVPIHDVGQDPDGSLYFIMKYVEGETLEHIIERLAAGDPDYHARFPFDRRARIILEVLRALQFAHGRRIVHRDLKPANIMLGPTGEVVLMDWGLARHLDRCDTCVRTDDGEADGECELSDSSMRRRLFATQRGTLLGTPAYMSPEQAAGNNDDVDERSDLYAVGVIAYELLTLRHPLADKTTLQSMLLAIGTQPATGATLVESPHQGRVPVELSHFLKHAMAKDPADRYPSALVMSADLENRMAGRFAVECPLTAAKRMQTHVLHAFDCSPFAVLGVALVLMLTFVASVSYSVYCALS